MRRLSWIALALAFPVVPGCGSSGSKGAPAVAVRIGGAAVRVDVASTPAARERGLAGRSGLAEDRGMLFVYRDHRERTYWMKGMRFPIDIVWIDRGRVTGVAPNLPVPAGGDLPLYPSGGPADRVLEVRAGWAARHRVEARDAVRISGL